MRTIQLLRKFKTVRIGVVGDLMLDRYIMGHVERISPEAPTPVVRFRSEEFRPGGAANTAGNIAALGAKAIVFGAVAEDAAGGKLLDILNESGIDTLAVTSRAGSTTEKTRIMAMNQQIIRLDKEDKGELDLESRESLLVKFSESLEMMDAVLISDYDKGVITADFIKKLLRAARSRHLPVIVAPKPSHFPLFHGVEIIVPNKKEVEDALGRVIEDETDLLRVGKSLGQQLQAPLLVTRGGEGMSLFEDERVRHIPSAAREVYDVTGAGDTVAAVLALGIASGASRYQAALLANTAAGIVVGKRGTATVSPEELSVNIHAI